MRRLYAHALFGGMPFIVVVCLTVCVAAPLYGQSPESASCDDLLEQSDSLSTRSFTNAWYSEADTIASRLDARHAILERADRQCSGNAKAETIAQKAYVEAQRRDFAAMTSTFSTFFEQYGRAPADTSTITATGFRSVHHYYAFLHYHTGDLAEAAQGYIRALEVTPEEHVTRRINLTENLALMYQRMRDRDAAMRAYQRALNQTEQLDSETDTYRRIRADLLSGLAGMQAELEAADNLDVWQSVAANLRESLDLVSDPGTAFQANRLSALAEAHANLDDIDTALSLSTEALAEARAAESARTLAFLQHTHGSFLMMDGQFDAAEPYLLRAVEAQPERRYEDRRRVLQRIGTLYERRGDLAEAASYYRQAIETVEAYRSGLRATEWAAAAFGGWQTAYRGLARVQLAQNNPKGALQTLERTRARHLADLRLEADVAHAMAPDQRVRYDSLTQVLQTLRSERSRTDSPMRAIQLRRQETEAVAARQELLNLPEATTAALSTIQDTLAAQNRVAISYMLDEGSERFGRPAQSHAFVITPDTVHAVPLDVDESTLNEKMASVSPWLASGQEDTQPNTGGIGSTHVDLHALHDVYQAVIAPVAPHLPEDASLTVIPDGALFRLPIAMLVSEAPQSRYDYASARFLVDDYPLSRQLSLSSLTDGSETERRPLDIAALGRSEFGEVMLDSLLADAVRPRSLRGSRGRADHHLPPLPGVERELRRVADLFRNRRMLLNNEATPNALNTLMGKTTILHLSSHALVSPHIPLQNAFVLSPSDTVDSTDSGLLYLHQLQGQFASIPLVNLSGCETAQGAFHKGEGMRSLQYAFRAVGARATLSNLWPIDDNAAVTLNEVFYDHVRRGMPKDAALQQAQLQYRRMYPDRSPFFWAGTMLHGSPAPLAVSGPPRWWRYAGALVLFGIIVLGAYEWRRRTA
ncbi:MAG: CHAT domain-containing tetratricopeptide repeat protein [Longimonas sp.]|uniref:CHAT domain-containing protein n=1 Tax=Longimonas sp. TaxID=2039626 RepID=UPI0039749D02